MDLNLVYWACLASGFLALVVGLWMKANARGVLIHAGLEPPALQPANYLTYIVIALAALTYSINSIWLVALLGVALVVVSIQEFREGYQEEPVDYQSLFLKSSAFVAIGLVGLLSSLGIRAFLS